MGRRHTSRARPRADRTRRRTPVAAIAALAVVGVVGVVGVMATGCAKDRAPAEGARTLDVDGLAVHAIVRGPTEAKAKLVVLFLHGGSYTSRIWDDRGILDDVAAAGYRAVAIDLPGYGETPMPEGGNDDPDADAAFIGAMAEQLGGADQVVIVSPSASGKFSLPYLATDPDPPPAGFVPIAPVGTETFRRPAGAHRVPTLIVWGEKDDVRPRNQMQVLADQLPGAQQEVIAGAGHAAYDDHPTEFTKLLLAFLSDAAARR
ncbi:MAG: hypothetical protein JWM89_1661 [Acidimicrobiales bacterium]|nr:hypothetical protein [Acidimicrobiales bacterium]